MAAKLEESYISEDVRPHARDFCAKSLCVTLLVCSLIGLICGVIAYHVAAGQSSINAFSTISEPNTYFMMGGFSALMIASSIALAYFIQKK